MNELMIVVGSSSLPVPNAFDVEPLLFPPALRQARDGSRVARTLLRRWVGRMLLRNIESPGNDVDIK